MKGDPYVILGIPHDSDMDFVKETYRQLMLYLHPDKGIFEGEEAERVDLMESVRTAYKTITSYSEFRDFPKDDVDYDDEMLVYQFREDFVKKTGTGTKKKKEESKTKKVNKNFHNMFEKIQTELNEEDPNKRGYSEFGTTTKISKSKITKVEYNPHDIFENVNSENVYKTSVEQEQSKDVFDLTFYGTSDLGLNEIHDLSIKFSDNVQGTDLSQAFTNHTVSEKDVESFREKYERADKTIEELMNERKNEYCELIEPGHEDDAKKIEAHLKDVRRYQTQMEIDKSRKEKIIKHIKN